MIRPASCGLECPTPHCQRVFIAALDRPHGGSVPERPELDDLRTATCANGAYLSRTESAGSISQKWRPADDYPASRYLHAGRRGAAVIARRLWRARRVSRWRFSEPGAGWLPGAPGRDRWVASGQGQAGRAGRVRDCGSGIWSRDVLLVAVLGSCGSRHLQGEDYGGLVRCPGFRDPAQARPEDV